MSKQTELMFVFYILVFLVKQKNTGKRTPDINQMMEMAIYQNAQTNGVNVLVLKIFIYGLTKTDPKRRPFQSTKWK